MKCKKAVRLFVFITNDYNDNHYYFKSEIMKDTYIVK